FKTALFVTVLVWVFMMITGLLLLEVTFHMPKGSNLISLSGRFLGKKGQWMTAGLFLFLYYALLVAYFSGGAPLLGQFLSFLHLSSWTEILLFVGVFGGIVCLGSRFISRVNTILSLGMIILFSLLVGMGSQGVMQERLFSQPFSLSMLATPVLFGAFGFHNVIPSLTSFLGAERKGILRASIIIGTTLALILYLVWQWLVLGSLSPDVLKQVLEKGLPVTYALASSSKMSIFVVGQIFAFFALTTSFLGVSFSLVDFIQDGFQHTRKRSMGRLTSTLLALSPPLLCVMLSPHLFDRALGVAGGFGEAILNGVLPVMLFARMKGVAIKRREKVFLFSLILFSLFVVLLEFAFLI
ncbi:MAG: hypothetical protein FJZ58_07515, partial [Chlamydiae bacterium]|nr:hypothetical protein [Chlamydiota bacterium]